MQMSFDSVTDQINLPTPELRPMSLGAEALLTVHDVAGFLRVPPSWVYERTRRRGRDRMPHIKVGKYLRFRREDVLGWLDEYRI
jgi:excisionase family DNA binding protein